MTLAVLKTPFMIINAIALFAASSATSSIESTSIPTTQSITERHLTVPIRSSYVSIRFDRNAQAPVAILAYNNDSTQPSDLLFMNTEVLPIVARVTGCNVAIDLYPDTQLLPSDHLNGVPLDC